MTFADLVNLTWCIALPVCCSMTHEYSSDNSFGHCTSSVTHISSIDGTKTFKSSHMNLEIMYDEKLFKNHNFIAFDIIVLSYIIGYSILGTCSLLYWTSPTNYFVLIEFWLELFPNFLLQYNNIVQYIDNIVVRLIVKLIVNRYLNAIHTNLSLRDSISFRDLATKRLRVLIHSNASWHILIKSFPNELLVSWSVNEFSCFSSQNKRMRIEVWTMTRQQTTACKV